MSNDYTIAIPCPLCQESKNIPYRQEKRIIANIEIDLGHNLCNSCGLQYVSPRPSNRALSLLYDNEYHTSTVSGVYNVDTEVSRNEYVTFTKYLKQHVEKKAHVLDVGCGVGNLLKEIQGQTDFECSGVELSEDAAGMARKSGFNVLNGSLHDANFDSGKFDAVSLLYVLEHVHNPMEILLEIRRVLKDDGYLFLAVPNYRYLHMAYESHFSKFLSDGQRTLHPEEHLQNFTPATLKIAVEKAGFKLVKHYCARPLVIGSAYVRFMKNASYIFVKVLSIIGYNIGGIHFILKKQNSKY